MRNTTTEHNLFISVTLEQSEFLVLFPRRKKGKGGSGLEHAIKDELFDKRHF